MEFNKNYKRHWQDIRIRILGTKDNPSVHTQHIFLYICGPFY